MWTGEKERKKLIQYKDTTVKKRKEKNNELTCLCREYSLTHCINCC